MNLVTLQLKHAKYTVQIFAHHIVAYHQAISGGGTIILTEHREIIVQETVEEVTSAIQHSKSVYIIDPEVKM